MLLNCGFVRNRVGRSLAPRSPAKIVFRLSFRTLRRLRPEDFKYIFNNWRSKLPLSGRNHPRWRPGAAGHPSRAASTLKPTGSDLRTLCGLLRLGSSLCASQPAKGTASGRRIFVEQTLCRCARGTCGLTVSDETKTSQQIRFFSCAEKHQVAEATRRSGAGRLSSVGVAEDRDIRSIGYRE